MSRAFSASKFSIPFKPLWLGGAVMATLLAGCEDGGGFSFGQKPEGTVSAGGSSTSVERDVEAPEVFSTTEPGLWDGRPSLGGVWVAHPDVTDPERVIIRNEANGKFVVGALFRREREIPGPKLQASSDAAEALGMLAGAPVKLNVTALRREEAQPDAPEPTTDAETKPGVDAPAPVSESSLDPIASAGAAIENAPEPPAPKPQQTSSLSKPFIQIGIFSVEANANRAAKQMRNAGMVPTIKRGSTSGKPFWRVIVGPAATSTERTALLKSIRTEGFSDAYAVSN